MLLSRGAVLLISLVCLTGAYKTGAPQGACIDLTPRHGDIQPQSSGAPYTVSPAVQRVSSGSSLRLQLSSPQGEAFKGFLVQAREKGSLEPLGTFVSIPELAKALTCGGGIKNTLTHVNNTDKKSLEIEWEAPVDFEGTVVFNSTFVKDGGTFWVGVESNTVDVVKRSVDDTRPAIGISTTKIPIRATTVPNYTPPRQVKVTAQDEVIYDGCGVTKLCFGFPDNCVNQKSCSHAVAIAASPSPPFDVTFELIGTTTDGSEYVAVGLSSDANMGSDSVMECTTEENVFFTSWNEGYINTRLRDNQGMVLVANKIENGQIYCKFTRPINTTVNSVTFNLQTDEYYLLLARGPRRDGNIGRHTEKTAASSAALLVNTGVIAPESKLLYRLHGAFMIAAWTFFAGTGMLVARYFKKTWVGKQSCGKDIWFSWHRSFMIITWVLNCAGFVIIFVQVGGWYGETSNPHGILGCVTTGLAFIQPFAAYFRPGPGTPRRPLFNWTHWFIGNLAHILGIITIFFAIELSVAELPKWNYGVMSAFVAFYAIMHVLLSISDCCSERNGDKRVNNFPMSDMGSNSRAQAFSEKRDAPYATLRKLLLAIYLIVTTLITVALIVITVLAPIEENEVVKKVMDFVVPAN